MLLDSILSEAEALGRRYGEVVEVTVEQEEAADLVNPPGDGPAYSDR